ncbi:hypothetical protein CASFOL_012513 [Castilleja foliolosa]|uniref:Myb-like domain-containing protein n=1 Tax=Castilleja foliolosa TaxID=1961234 RepID=A0ABD3DHA5_9LAMI
MLGVSGLMGSSGDGAADGAAHEASGGSSEAGAASSSVPGGGMEESGGGNRWPRQETLALLKIRSDMDAVFRDSSLKGPLWDEVSRKMAELGYQRSSKKCKEKFENVYKYHKRTKDGRASKTDGKTYRFFDQLEAFESTPPPSFNPPPPRPAATTPLPMSSTASPNPVSVATPAQISINPINTSQPPYQPPQAVEINTPNPQIHSFQPHFPANLLSNSTSTSSTSSDEDIQPPRRGRKRKWKDFFDRLMKDVIHKQEELQKKFIDALEKRERDRTAREEAWRAQETARMNREHELLVQERSIAAAKDAAVIAFLQKVTDQQPNFQIPIVNNNAPPPPPENPQPPPQRQQQQEAPPPIPPAQVSIVPPPPKPIVAAPVSTPTKFSSDSGGGDNSMSASSSRWPKAEVEALINLRTNLDLKYQDNGPKGPLWEEISSAMAKIGYNRSSKRCKEKWENINKYFKKVKESNKRRPEDSKTCPYFHQLDALYKEKAKIEPSFNPGNNNNYSISTENPMAPIMARPEQQWPLPPPGQQHQPHDPAMLDIDLGNENNSDDNDEDEDDDDDDGGGFEIVSNKQPSTAAE